jgi:hypothetical protein
MKVAPTLVLSLAAVSLAGCAGDSSVTSTSGLDKRPNLVSQPMPYKAGTGVVQTWAAAPSPAAGASGRVDPAGGGMLRLGIRMDDGRIQYVDTDSRDFPIGTRVQLTEDRIIQRP